MPDNQSPTPDSAGVDRTPTGQIADQGQTTSTAATTAQTTTTTEPTEEKSLINQEEKSLANQQTPGAGAPETYAEFKVPDGYVLDEAVAKEATGIFKGMGLTQEQAQQLVDFYTAKTTESQNRPYQVWAETQQKWVKEVKADPFLGPRLNQVTSTISKGIDQVVSSNPQLSKLAEEFRTVMDFTGAGNHPAFIRMFYELASMVTEGGHVTGRGPSPAGQAPSPERTSAARAMYPNLP